MTDWCILRTAPRQTLDLARSLAEARFETWTPVETIQRRARKLLKREEEQAPLMPSFVFARGDSAAELSALSRSPSLNFRVWDAEQRRMVTKGHPHFRVFKHDDRYALIHERELTMLRAIERRHRPKSAAKSFKAGQTVKLTEGSFAGLSGVVQAMAGGYAEVLFPGFAIPVKISAWLLLDDEPCVNVGSTASEQAPIAEAA